MAESLAVVMRQLSRISGRVGKLLSSTYVRNVLTTGYGVAFAQAIPLLVAPVLTRIYSAEEFGFYAYYASLTAVLMVLSTGRYEIAILMPEKDSDALSLAILSVGLSLSVCLFLSIFLLVFASIFLDHSVTESRYFLWTLIAFPGTVLQVCGRVLFLWANRKKSYRLMSRSRIIQALTMTILSVLFGLMGLAEGGLVIGLLLGAASGGIMLIPNILNAYFDEKNRIDKYSIICAARKFDRFPKYTLIGDALNILAWRLPVLSFLSLFGAAAAGNLAIAYRVVGLPSIIAGTAFLGVFRQAAAERLRTNGECRNLYNSTFKYLFILGLFAFTPLIFFGPELFVIVFGSDWRPSGEYVQVLSLLFLIGFVASPLGSLMQVGNRQNWDMYWQWGFFLNTLFALGLGNVTGNLSDTLISLSLGGALLYLAYLHLSRKVAFNSPHMMG